MGNCLETCTKDMIYGAHVEDVLLEIPQRSVQKMEREAIQLKEKKLVKRVRFCEEVEHIMSCKDINVKEESAGCDNVCNDVVKGGELKLVKIVLRKEEAAILMRLMEDGEYGKTLEELIGELGAVQNYCGKLHDSEDVWRPVLATVPENESMD